MGGGGASWHPATVSALNALSVLVMFRAARLDSSLYWVGWRDCMSFLEEHPVVGFLACLPLANCLACVHLTHLSPGSASGNSLLMGSSSMR